MALRNAFEGLATESGQGVAILTLRQILKAVTYAKTADDQLRVTVAPGALFYSYGTYWGWAGVNPVPYGPGAPNTLDAREQQKMLSDISFAQTRQRWVIT